MSTARPPSGGHAERNGLEALLVGVVGLLIALAAGLGASSTLARFFTGVLVGLSIAAMVAGLVWMSRRPGPHPR